MEMDLNNSKSLRRQANCGKGLKWCNLVKGFWKV